MQGTLSSGFQTLACRLAAHCTRAPHDGQHGCGLVRLPARASALGARTTYNHITHTLTHTASPAEMSLDTSRQSTLAPTRVCQHPERHSRYCTLSAAVDISSSRLAYGSASSRITPHYSARHATLRHTNAMKRLSVRRRAVHDVVDSTRWCTPRLPRMTFQRAPAVRTIFFFQ